MTHTRPVFSAAQALRSAFLPRIQTHARRPVTGSLNVHKLKRLNHSERQPLQHPPRDEAIRHQRVHIVEEDGSIGPAIPLRQVLGRFDRTEYSLVELISPSENYGSICKIMSKRTLREQEYARSRTSKPKPAKQIELNWAIDPNDLENRLNQMESFIAKGKKVELILTSKARKRKATEPEAQKTLAAVKEKIQEIGAIQSKKMQGRLLGHVQFFLEGKK
ncbi:translation initiation factor IF-3, putative [Coccidioides posadasii C735 delta SOWgp]|uniref:Translation initiation factor IF-3, putative n=1 Tax=Coccidioides posadasii (strain C735) TaxID=222929 RepID=C5PCP8_COCP7|nr:translation initiation factor IF-3, putative [Coccidioides posadasii C735 delta SOWgp]EER24859.1 translation initiation factor IF-3, putative [Coccidioides posadasii C735 delta SOWgp]|eukprot:XP_003067004.1 translation initiation factor IF-3, putative [Coccidioides posadasii C735 delta SOWgp]